MHISFGSMSDSKVVQDDDFVETRKSELKKQGDDAFGMQDYINASAFYTQVCCTKLILTSAA